MEGQKAILDKILSDAREKSSSIELESKNECKRRLDSAKKWAEDYTNAQNEILSREIEGIKAGKKLNAELDVKKTLLKAKRSVLDDAFVLAYEKLCKIDKASYLKLVESLIDENAEDGDEIVLSKDGVLDVKDIDVSKFKAKNLKVSEKKGDFIGGVTLSGSKSDKDLSFKAVIDGKKEELTSLAVDSLF